MPELSRLFHHRQDGFLLIEAMIAILIFSVGVLAIIGLQTMAIKDTQQSRYRNEASYLANSIVAQMRVDAANFSNYDDDAGTLAPRRGDWDAEVAAALPNGSGSIQISGTAVTVIVSWREPDEVSAHNHTAVSQVVF